MRNPIERVTKQDLRKSENAGIKKSSSIKDRLRCTSPPGLSQVTPRELGGPVDCFPDLPAYRFPAREFYPESVPR